MRFPKYRLLEEDKGGDPGEGAGNGTGNSTSQGQDKGGVGTGQGTGQDQVPAWPATWRQQIAGTDEKGLKQLERYASPADIWNKARALEQKISSGEYKSATPYPDKGTPEQQAEWRKLNGVPEAPDKYDLNLGDGVVIGEADKPIVDEFLKAMHAANMPNGLAKPAIQWYLDFAEKQAEALYENDQKAKTDFEDALRPEWGNEYRANIQSINNMLAMAPNGLAERLLNARMADGTPFGSDPDTMRWLVSLSREINPIPSLTGMGQDQSLTKVEDRIKDIENTMRTDRAKYNKDEKMQEEYRQLLDFRQRNTGKK